MKLNKIVKYLIYSDLVFYTGWGLISPVFAIFILDSIIGGNVFVVGIASAINLLSRSLIRVPAGMYADNDKTGKRAFWGMFLGLFVAAFIPFGYIISTLPWHIYILQAIMGVSLGISAAGWTCIFSKYLDGGKASTEWGLDVVAVGVGPGIAAAVGGLAVTYFGFNIVFIIVGIFGIIGTLVLLFVYKDLIKKPGEDGKLFISHEARRLKKRIH